MTRQDLLLQGITKDQVGIEVGPYFAPLVPKSAGYKSISTDVFDQEYLKNLAANDAFVGEAASELIEPVDLLGSVSELGEMIQHADLAGKLDYVISSHNFEHIPDPVRFLQACELGLTPNGIVSLAMPDCRTCFDHYRPYSITADFLGAYFERRLRPTAQQVFALQSLHCLFNKDGALILSCNLGEDTKQVHPLETLQEAFDAWNATLANPEQSPYRDTHCWVLTPSVFELIIRDLNFLGLTALEPVWVSENYGHEFFVRLSKRQHLPLDREVFYRRRAELLRKIKIELSVQYAGETA